jgi:pilus assembly protein Flp/PilA
MKTFVQDFISDESGATAIEYGLIAALIAIALIGGASTVGKNTDSLWNNVSTAFDTAN